MNKNSILLVDPNLNPANSRHLSLLIKIGVDTFSYIITDQEKQFVHAVYDEQECENVNEKFKERLKADAYLALTYKTVALAVYTPNMVFVPNDFFKEEDIKLYAQFFTDDNFKRIFTQPSAKQQFTYVYTAPSSIEKLAIERWPNAKMVPYEAGLIETDKESAANTIFIDFSVGSFQFTYFKDQQINLAKVYEFEHIDELAYYFLLLVSQLGIDLKQHHIKVSGIIHQGDEKWNLLAQHCEQLAFNELHSMLNTGVLDDMPTHYYTNLVALNQCG